MTLKKAKRILILKRCLLILAILCLTASVAAFFGGSYLKSTTYEQFISISSATDPSEKRNTFLRAIRLCPDRPEAYILLLETYGEDGVFTKAESDEFLATYNSLHSNIPKDNIKTLLCRSGLLYVNAYDGSMTTRLRMALPFLEQALPLLSNSDPEAAAISCYCKIGAYYRDYIWDISSVREVSRDEMNRLAQELHDTLEAFSVNTSPDAIFNRLGFCVAACDLLYNQRDIFAATVPQETILGIFDSLYSGLPNAQQLHKEQTKSLLAFLDNNRVSYREAIERAYQRTEGVWA